MTRAATETIAAVATAPGSGGVGIVRLSGPDALAIARVLCARDALTPRHAHHVRFLDAAGDALDDGIALLFQAPASYTGEDVVELQAHGNPVLLQAIVARCCALGARLARPGEFTERAFLNGRLDLAQAEAVADLIAAGDLTAARAARRSLDGRFSRRVEAIAAELLAIRVHAEAAIDFADEPLETLGGAQLAARLQRARAALEALLGDAKRGRRLRDGLHAVIVGPPNAGKSSLLNALAGSERAIVTDVAGTTRDLLRETVHVDGAELVLVDTAGLREEGDAIEREGMRRARQELGKAGLAIAVVDARDPDAGRAAVAADVDGVPQVLWLHNKADLLAAHAPAPPPGELRVSATTGQGMDALHARLRTLVMGDAAGDGEFTARARHVDALRRAALALDDAAHALEVEALDLAAESLRDAHHALGDITGRVDADALLGHIFSSFCIGK
ncbi:MULTISPECIES: tRNA uridine-5-carboxymethylaminomethyl(34) synthesis GTPase MnmE [unclassified Luteimonas]|uniref:tRNA uridine-5-carboxymethylaminomethyl(34) synthesis GTPase MnmE n=1 Tax=unclassified Luteimonas TaxID=2629088 RepID=UPI0018F0CCF6|nr:MULTISPECIES: tRNA uridine-5-carboxymethylaminomethyl(34) synthesis GTPase MnmE [unclassified Luteimonas]MBJ6979219.1 tRNA uridine-5-carboxymethylaminomethyl(34) synthesis GTPase MnmE [Luteimonas sp. MC1895]MBJ6985236.1 tRNA uridine-5-carboxymethylaminomethyl(34) synthesis GTPase MnmE [Luteimonas sp. MC1750]QQO05882.1 tRNA uridine-5-carboxymethylaminomethyl(34) synthesis GTPase MnmE [Luteimonas sp. MC1750]